MMILLSPPDDVADTSVATVNASTVTGTTAGSSAAHQGM